MTNQAGVAGRTDAGVGAAGAFHSQGAGGDASSAGYVHYDRATGEVTRGGVIDANDHVYAGKDGNVYQYDKDSGWEKVDPQGGLSRVAGPDSADTDHDRLARNRSAEGATFEQRQPPVAAQPQFDRSNYDNRFHGEMGGFRPSMGEGGLEVEGCGVEVGFVGDRGRCEEVGLLASR